jgi:hypothetical protein
MGFFDTNNYSTAGYQKFRLPRVDEMAEKLNGYISNNRMDRIEVFIRGFRFSGNEAINEWLFAYGGIEAIRKWRQFCGHEDIEKEN